MKERCRVFLKNMQNSESLGERDSSDYEVVARLLNFHGMPPLCAMEQVQKGTVGNTKVGQMYVVEYPTTTDSSEAMYEFQVALKGKNELGFVRLTCLDCGCELKFDYGQKMASCSEKDEEC
jgi:hypothetical protein